MTAAAPTPVITPAWRRGSLQLMFLLGAAGVANVAVETLRGVRFPDQADWPVFVAAGRILAAAPHSLYDVTAQMSAQRAILGGNLPYGFFPFRSPAPVAALYQPFASLPLGTGRAMFALLSLTAFGIAIGALWRLAPPSARGPAAILLAVMAATVLPGDETFLYSQPAALILLAFTGALLARRNHHELLAGVLLGAGLAKPQTIWLVVPLLVILREGRILAGLAVAGCAGLVVGALLVGPGWLIQWLQITAWNGSEISIADGLPGLVFLLTNSMAAVLAVAGAGLLTWVVVAWRWRAELARQPAIAIALGVAASLVVAPHVFAHDVILIAPLLVLAARHVGERLVIAVAGLDAAYLAEYSLGLGTPQLDGLVLLALTVWLFVASTRHGGVPAAVGVRLA